LRDARPVVRPSNTVSGWTLGKRTRDYKSGSISALAVDAREQLVSAGTSDGALLTWDVRNLKSVLCCTRVSRALAGRASSGVDSLLPHPRVRDTLLAQLSCGAVAAVDVCAGAILCHTAVEDPASAARRAEAVTREEEPPAAASFAHRGNRLAWLCGDEWLACGVPSSPAVGLLQLNHGCSAIAARLFTPTSAPLCALSASPRGHFVALGLEDGSIGMLHPLANKREAEERAAEEARDASSKRQASAERAVDAARSWLEPSLRAAGYHWGGASRALSLLCCAAPESDATSLLGWLGGSSPAPVLTALEAVALEGAAPAPSGCRRGWLDRIGMPAFAGGEGGGRGGGRGGGGRSRGGRRSRGGGGGSRRGCSGGGRGGDGSGSGKRGGRGDGGTAPAASTAATKQSCSRSRFHCHVCAAAAL